MIESEINMQIDKIILSQAALILLFSIILFLENDDLRNGVLKKSDLFHLRDYGVNLAFVHASMQELQKYGLIEIHSDGPESELPYKISLLGLKFVNSMDKDKFFNFNKIYADAVSLIFKSLSEVFWEIEGELKKIREKLDWLEKDEIEAALNELKILKDIMTNYHIKNYIRKGFVSEIANENSFLRWCLSKNYSALINKKCVHAMNQANKLVTFMKSE